MIKEADWDNFDEFTIKVTFDWKSGSGTPPSPDYTLLVHSEMDIDITSVSGDETATNMLHMDGTCPSGFSESDHSYCKRVHIADQPQFKRIKTIGSLVDVFTKGDDFTETVRTFFRNSWTVFWWYDWFSFIK